MKVVHDCRPLLENFEYKLKVRLQPVFDLMLTAAQFHNTQDVISLNGCVKTVLGVDPDISEDVSFIQRPVGEEKIREIATKTAFHLAMYQKLAAKNFASFFEKSDEYFKSKAVQCRTTTANSDSVEKFVKRAASKPPKKIDMSIYQDD